MLLPYARCYAAAQYAQCLSAERKRIVFGKLTVDLRQPDLNRETDRRRRRSVQEATVVSHFRAMRCVESSESPVALRSNMEKYGHLPMAHVLSLLCLLLFL